MNVFEFKNYKSFVVKRIQSMPKRGHGQFRKMAMFLSINSVNVTQIFKGDRDLTTEQACLLCEFFGLSDLESEYFVGLVQYARAGHHKLRLMIQKRLDEILEKSQDLKQRLRSDAHLSEEAKSHFYSNWYNSGIRLLTSIEGFQEAEAIAQYLNLPRVTVNRSIEFLLQTGLCVEKNGRIYMGPSSTHLEANSPLVHRHHANWRIKAIERMENMTAEDLCLTMPCSVSRKAQKEIRKEFINFIERITHLIDEGPEESLMILNIDWLKI